MGGSALGWAWLGHLSWGSFAPHVLHRTAGQPGLPFSFVAKSEKQQREQKLDRHTQQAIQPSALVMSAIILLAKANYMVQHRMERQEMYATSQREELQKLMTGSKQTEVKTAHLTCFKRSWERAKEMKSIYML